MKHSIDHFTSVDRRGFLRTAGAVSTLFVLSPAFSITPVDQSEWTEVSDQEVEESIKVNFGSGFQVLSYQQKSSDTFIARVEHLQNEYSVVSEGLTHWQIVESTEI